MTRIVLLALAALAVAGVAQAGSKVYDWDQAATFEGGTATYTLARLSGGHLRPGYFLHSCYTNGPYGAPDPQVLAQVTRIDLRQKVQVFTGPLVGDRCAGQAIGDDGTALAPASGYVINERG